jgi:hypothetical protein
MADRTREAGRQEPRSTTVLDPLRPAVVVRRRVYDATIAEQGVETPRAFSTTSQSFVAEDDDESGPPSSINVARALASLRSDELQRVEDLVRADEARSQELEADDEDEEDDDVESTLETAPPAAPIPEAPAKPTLTLGKTVKLSELAERMGVSARDLPATLVARGFYALDAKTVLPRQTARVIAEMYGWHVEDGPPELDEAPPVKSGPRSRIATKRKVGAKAKAKPTKVKAKAKPAAKRRLAR